jgi:hypothetical protein
MNWKEFMDLVEGLIANDVAVPSETGVSIELFRRAMWITAELADTQTLQAAFVEGVTTDVLRQHGTYTELYIRKFKLPTKDSDKIDIDDLLIFVVAHYFASSIASTLELKGYHESKAKELTEMFNQKIRSYTERAKQVL